MESITNPHRFFCKTRPIYSEVVASDDGFVIVVTNTAKCFSMEVSSPIIDESEAIKRAMKWVGLSTQKPINYDDLDFYLSDRLGY